MESLLCSFRFIGFLHIFPLFKRGGLFPYTNWGSKDGGGRSGTDCKAHWGDVIEILGYPTKPHLTVLVLMIIRRHLLGQTWTESTSYRLEFQCPPQDKSMSWKGFSYGLPALLMISHTAAGVAGTMDLWSRHSLPMFTIWKPSTSFSGAMALHTARSLMCSTEVKENGRYSADITYRNVHIISNHITQTSQLLTTTSQSMLMFWILPVM